MPTAVRNSELSCGERAMALGGAYLTRFHRAPLLRIATMASYGMELLAYRLEADPPSRFCRGIPIQAITSRSAHSEVRQPESQSRTCM
jgi:hypothetical protein